MNLAVLTQNDAELGPEFKMRRAYWPVGSTMDACAVPEAIRAIENAVIGVVS